MCPGVSWCILGCPGVIRLTPDSIELDEPLTATDMRMRENDVTLGIPKTSYRTIFLCINRCTIL